MDYVMARSFRFRLALLLTVVAVCLSTMIVRADGDLVADADRGRFDEVLRQLEAMPQSHRTANLIDDLRRYETHKTEHLNQRQDGLSKALERMNKYAQEDKLDLALLSAEEARSLALDKNILMAEPTVVAVTAKAREQAESAEKEGRWLDALNLLRGLNVLYEIDGQYKHDLERVVNRVRLIRVYAPEKLEQLYQQRAKRLGEDDAEPLNLDAETWRNRLDSIDWRMMEQALDQAALKHIDGKGYRPMLLSGFDAMLALTKTNELHDIAEFTDLRDPLRADAFEAAIDALKNRLHNENEAAMGQGMLNRYLRALRIANEETIRLPEKVVAFEMTEGAMQALDDYSAVIWPHELPQLLRTLHGNFFGVGILLSRTQGKLVVKSPLENGPAIRGGIRAGDVIAEVDGQPTAHWALDKAVEQITGPEHTRVVLTIERGHKINWIAEGKSQDDGLGLDERLAPDLPEIEPNEADIKRLHVTLQRASIAIGSVLGWDRKKEQGDWDFMIDPHWRIGYMRITQFLPQTADDLDTALSQLTVDGPINGLIVDLRFNPGGLLRAAVDVSDRFIRKGPIVSTVDRRRREQEKHVARAHRTYPDFPVVVLINQGSASASEIVSGALQDYRRATLIGTRTFGKGSVQDMFNLPNGRSLLKLTTQYYRLPNNRIIHRKPHALSWGVEPDLPVEMTDQQVIDQLRFRSELDVLHVAGEPENPDQPWPKAQDILDKGVDPQLEAALLMLKTRQFAQQRDNQRQAHLDHRD